MTGVSRRLRNFEVLALRRGKKKRLPTFLLIAFDFMPATT